MGMRMPETCWTVFKRQVINSRSCASCWLIRLKVWWCTDLQTLNTYSVSCWRRMVQQVISHISHIIHPVSCVNCQPVAVTANYKVQPSWQCTQLLLLLFVIPHCNISKIRTPDVLSVALLKIYVLWAVTPCRWVVPRVPKFLHLLLEVFDHDDDSTTIRKHSATTLQEQSDNTLRRIIAGYCDNHTKRTDTLSFETYIS